MTDASALRAIAERHPIPMLLWCPKCNEQHIDAPSEGWDNPPHRSHLCHACGCIWRPADVCTTGVEDVKTAGEADTWGWTGGDSLLPSLGKRLADAQIHIDAQARALEERAWRPIETAPRDGSLIDLWWDGVRMVDCWCQELEDMGWVCSKSAGHPFLLSEIRAVPTHWMKPEPPASQSLARQEGVKG